MIVFFFVGRSDEDDDGHSLNKLPSALTTTGAPRVNHDDDGDVDDALDDEHALATDMRAVVDGERAMSRRPSRLTQMAARAPSTIGALRVSAVRALVQRRQGSAVRLVVASSSRAHEAPRRRHLQTTKQHAVYVCCGKFFASELHLAWHLVGLGQPTPPPTTAPPPPTNGRGGRGNKESKAKRDEAVRERGCRDDGMCGPLMTWQLLC